MEKKVFRKNFIVKSNSLIEARYKLSLQESRVILWLLNQIKPDDENFKSYQLNIIKFSEIISLNVDNQYTQLKKITKHLTKQSLEIYDSKKETLLQVSWLSAAFYEFKKGYVTLEFSPYLKPYLLKIKSHFTKIETVDLLKLKSIYAIRIFELLKQYEQIRVRQITVNELRSYCGIKEGQYRNYNAIKLYIIERSKIEINSKTDYFIDYKEIKESRKVVAIEWTIGKKNLVAEEHSKKIIELQKELRSQDVLLEALSEYGFSKLIGKRLLKTHDEEVVKNALRAVDLQIQRHHAKNPKAMLQTAILEKWHPEVFKKKKKTASSLKIL